MKTFNDAVTYGKFLAGLRGYLKREMGYDEAAAVVRHRMENRDAMFLDVLETRYLNAAHSPYPALFEYAGCEFGDVADGVRRDGLEHTLKSLLDAGVYLTFEEFKGRQPIVRGGREIPAGPEAFENRQLKRYYHLSTGGSTGTARQIAVDLEHMWGQVPNQRIVDTIQGLVGTPMAHWFDGLPGNGLNALVARVPSGTTPERWFCPTLDEGSRPALKFRLAQAGIVAVSRRSMDLPRPELARLSEPELTSRYEATAAGRLDLAMLSEPFLGRFRNEGGHVGFQMWELFPDVQYSTFAFGPRLLHEDRELGRLVATALLRGVRTQNLGKTDRNIEILHEALGWERALLEEACWAPMRDDGRINTESIAEFQEWALARGDLDEIVPPSVYLDTTFAHYARERLDGSP